MLAMAYTALTLCIWRRASAIYKISIPKNSSYVNIVIDVLFAGQVLTCAGMELIYHQNIGIAKGFKSILNQKRKIRQAYRTHFCETTLTSVAIGMESPKAKRQCTQELPNDVYTEKTSTDSFMPNDRTRLLEFNKLSMMPAWQKLKDPITMDEAQHKNNVYLRKQVHWYCEQALDIVSPGHGKDLYRFIGSIEQQYANQNIQKTLNRVLDNLVELYLFGSACHDKRLAFVELCGVLTFNDLNTRLFNRITFGRSQGDRCGATDQFVKRDKYNTGGTSCSLIFILHTPLIRYATSPSHW